jgi:hypothetical protein
MHLRRPIINICARSSSWCPGQCQDRILRRQEKHTRQISKKKGLIRTKRASSGPTRKRTEGRAPVWGSEFTTKAAKPHGDSNELFPSLCVVNLNQLQPAPTYTAQHPLRDYACSHRPFNLRSLFRCETPDAEHSASGYRIAPSHLIFTELTQLRAAARLAMTSPLAVKRRNRRRAWRSHGRHRVRKT